MRLREEKIDDLSRKVFFALRNHKRIRINQKDVKVFLEVKRRITEDLKREDEINEEVKELLEQHRDEILRQNLDYAFLFRKIKGQIIKERGLII